MHHARRVDEQHRADELAKLQAFLADFANAVNYGECFYCRDGVKQMLVPHRESYVFDGDVVYDEHMVCRECERWLARD